ncbi:MAG: pyruvate dehydrogenase (acetyl-transferring) E1 component subunit alpha [Chloroflexi bacterium]|nr:pyruvate dehydrogenase (acetyl-transferring) E1 component subunit alpha [Chloroflexota bacterium]
MDGAGQLTKEKLIDMLRKMHTIRAFEEKADQLFALGKVHGTMHLSIGMEATAVGAIAALRPDDYITSTHRGHGHCIAKGGDVKLMMAEFLGKETGYCRGRGGSMHIADVESGNLGATGVVGGGIPTAVGAALSVQLRKTGQVVLCFFGDGAANMGIFHESLNLAAIWKLPVVFVCENNQYAMSMPVARAFPIENIADRAAAYAMPGKVVDGNDVLAVYAAVAEAVDRARAGEGPSLIECKTYRWKGHSKSDQERYRTREEVAAWKKKDPIARFEAYLLQEGLLTEEQRQAIAKEAQERIEEAVAFAESSPEPRVEEISEGVYA